MKILLIGRGKMGRLLEETARAGGDETAAAFDRSNLAELAETGRIADMNGRLAELTAERDRYRENSVVLSLLVLRGGGDVRALSAQARLLLGPGEAGREDG